jgi:hypothetical protein
MSYSSLFNSPSYGQTFTLTNLGGARATQASAATAIRELGIITVAGGASDLYITLPAGKYLADIECCLTTTVNGTAVDIKFAQLQLIGINTTGANQLLGYGTSYNKNMDGTLVNILDNNLFMKDTVFIILTETTQITARLAYNIDNICATKSGNIGTNPVLSCENKIIFKEVL